jgi:SAM-dependent methyltransferase
MPEPNLSFVDSRFRAFKLCAFGIKVGLALGAKGHIANALKTTIYPLGYWRFLPIAYLMHYAAQIEDCRILDVASPKLVSLYLASRGATDVQATDLDDKTVFSRWKVAADTLKLRNYSVSFQDARQLQFPDNHFDLVYSISVIEHIPEEGDTDALREFRRVLKPGGIAIVEVPFRRKAETIYRPYSSKGEPSPDGKPLFYERYYDSRSLNQRLSIHGMAIEKCLLLGEWLPLDPWIAARRLPRLLRAAVLPFEPLLAAVNYWAHVDDQSGRPLAALLVYRKSD